MLIHTRCPIDDSDDTDVELYPANFDPAQLNAAVFSARRLPDRIHYRMVRNRRTGCLRADPILDQATLLSLYRDSHVTYESVAPYTAATYLRYLNKALPHLSDRRGALEIGCGHGFFLERLGPLGFALLRGVEPSREAAAKAAPGIRDAIVTGVLALETFPPESFSLICGFQVLDHLANPLEVLGHCRRVLAPGGVMFWICHDVGSWPARLLGRSCPMVDIEHVVLYDRCTIRALFARADFEVLDVFGVRNCYPLSYWSRLAPLPPRVKAGLLHIVEKTPLGRLALTANLGNQGIVARKAPTPGAVRDANRRPTALSSTGPDRRPIQRSWNPAFRPQTTDAPGSRSTPSQ